MRYRLVPERSRVWIEGTSSLHPIRSSATGLEGWFEVEVAPDGSVGPPVAGRVEIPVDALRSGNPLIDRESRRRADVARHPTITGELTAIEGAEGERLRAHGTIAFRGERCEVTGDLIVTATAGGIHVEGTERFDVRDWGLEPPALLTLKVHPDVTVRIAVDAEPED